MAFRNCISNRGAPPAMNRVVSNAMVSMPFHGMPIDIVLRHGNGRVGEKDERVRGRFHYNAGNTINHPEVKATPCCVVCGKELEPPARAPHTNYVKSLYQLAGQTYCHHHVIKAAVAAGVVRAGTGSDIIFVNPRQ